MQKIELRAHLIELRNRFMIVALFVLVGCVLAVFFQTEVIAALLRPLEGESLIYTSPYGGFEFIFKVVLFLGMIFAVPVALYQVFQFIAPALPEKIDGLGTKIIIISTILAISGVSFAYFVAIPASLRFLNNIGGEFLDSLISTNEYLSFFMIYLLGFAVIFQLPLIMSIIDKNHPLQPSKLIKKQKYIIMGSYIVAAVLTPTPDAMNQTIMALPIVALYQVGIGVVWTQRQNNKDNDPLTENEVSWYTREVYEDPVQDNFNLDEEKYRGRSVPTKKRKKPQLVMDVMPTAQSTQKSLQPSLQSQHITTTSTNRSTSTAPSLYQRDTIKSSKLPLTYDLNAVSSAPKSVRKAPTLQKQQQQHPKKANIMSNQPLDLTPRASRQPSYANIVIRNRPIPLMQG